MPLTILSVAYPLAPVGRDAVGGAEQVLTLLDEGLTRAGHRSLVVACEGSQVSGELRATPRVVGPLGEEARARAQAAHRAAIERALDELAVDVVHLHGIDFHRYLPSPGVPVLATLHLPPAWYPREAFARERPDTHLNCVSRSQLRQCPLDAPDLRVIPNGVRLEHFRPRRSKRGYVLALGRICPERASTSPSTPRAGPACRCCSGGRCSPTRPTSATSARSSSRGWTPPGASSGRWG